MTPGHNEPYIFENDNKSYQTENIIGFRPNDYN